MGHAFAVWQRNASMYARTWAWNLLPNFFEPVFYLSAVGIGVGAYIESMGGLSYAAFLAPGLLCVSAMNGASFEVTYNVYIRMTYEHAYDAMLTTPVEPEDVLVGELAWAITRALIYGLSFFAILCLMGLAPLPRALAVLPVLVLAGTLFAAMGMAFALSVTAIELFSYYFTLFLTPLFLFSDVFFPLAERLSPPWMTVAEALPLLHPVRLARMAFHGPVQPLTAAWELTYIVVLAAALGAWSVRRMRARLTS
jgi:lipooligosaccharide transport system permease protein